LKKAAFYSPNFMPFTLNRYIKEALINSLTQGFSFVGPVGIDRHP
jgi:hypothetical protein